MRAWQPLASLSVLQQRAALIKTIREFFYARQFLEVETPILSKAATTDPQLQSLKTGGYYLQTSPEYAMKRLLAAGSGSIFQICKAFRKDEIGRLHLTEFTLLEWYHLGFNYFQLMDEVDDFLQITLHCKPASRCSYLQLFEKHLSINPHLATLDELQQCCCQHGIHLHQALDSQAAYLDLLMTHVVEKKIGHDAPCFIYDYPESGKALASLKKYDNYLVAERFEVYYQGVELANGFNELTDANEQLQRLEDEQKQRDESVPIDYDFIAALNHGLPSCAGIALGIDRLCMLAFGQEHIESVVSFR